jgi:glycosyltransferase involved in cell wall biosynthesis
MSPKIGLIARCDDRGLASMTHEFARHMSPAKILLIRMNDPKWPEFPERYDGLADTITETSPLDDWLHLDERTVRDFVDGLDVVYSAETMYDWRITPWAHEVGCRTICHLMPEFYRHNTRPDPHPDVWAYPTPWLVDQLPAGPILPVPCVERPQVAADPYDGPLRVLHVSGHAAAADRNGTLLVLDALSMLRGEVHLTVIGQDGWLPDFEAARGRRSNITVDVNPIGVADRWDLYRYQHVVLLPRRYGGLSLPALEAMASGCAIIMPDCVPNTIWPIIPVRARASRMHNTPFGLVRTHTVHPLDLALTIDRLAGDRSALEGLMGATKHWVDRNTWAMLKPMNYDPLMEGTS